MPGGRDRPLPVAYMGKLTFGRLSEAWAGEATDFTPLLVDRLDQIGEAIDVDLASAGRAEVPTSGGRRIDIVAQNADGTELVIENQYGRADHDHLTRGLAYAVARNARGLVVIAESHRDEFRAVAQYLNDVGERDPERGIAVWLVEARAVRVDDGPWAPLFTAVVAPNEFTRVVEQAKAIERSVSLDEFLQRVEGEEVRDVVSTLLDRWEAAGYRFRVRPDAVVLEAPGPAASKVRVVVSLSTDGRVSVPFESYDGRNTGVPVEALGTPEFRARANQLFGFLGDKQYGRTESGWITADRAEALWEFCTTVASAYSAALIARSDDNTASGATPTTG